MSCLKRHIFCKKHWLWIYTFIFIIINLYYKILKMCMCYSRYAEITLITFRFARARAEIKSFPQLLWALRDLLGHHISEACTDFNFSP